MLEDQQLNMFREARLEAGLDIEKAAQVVNDPHYNWYTIKKVESVQHPYPLPAWGHKYLSALRRVAFENSCTFKNPRWE